MKKKTRLILIVAVGLLAVTVFVFKGRTEMKHGRYHRFLVAHSIQHKGVYEGKTVRDFVGNYAFNVKDGYYSIEPDGSIVFHPNEIVMRIDF